MILLTRLIAGTSALALLTAPVLAGSNLPPVTDATPLTLTPLAGQQAFVPQVIDNAAAGWRIVGARTGNGGGIGSNASNYQAMNRIPVPIPAGASAIKVCYGGWGNIAPDIAYANANAVLTDATVIAGSGGTGYQVGDIIIEATPVAGNVAAKLRVLAVSSGAVTKVALEDPGSYGPSVLADGSAQASTANAAGNAGGSGATFTFKWKSYATHIHLGVEPAGSNQATSGPLAIRQATQGYAKPSGAFQSGNTLAAPAIDIEVPSAGIACSDPIAVGANPGDVLWLRQWVDGVGTGFARYVMPGESSTFGNPTAPDQSVSGTMTANATTSATPGNIAVAPTYAPLMVLGLPKKYVPSFVLITDSIGFGSTCATVSQCSGQLTVDAGAPDVNGIYYKGPYERPLQGNFPWMHLGHPGDALTYKFGAQYGRELDYAAIDLAQPSNALVALSINDFNLQGKTAAQVLAYEQQMGSELHAKPYIKRVFGVTTTPNTTTPSSGVPSSTSCPQIQVRNPSLRIGLTAGGTYAPQLASFVSGTAVTAPGSATITPDAMSKTTGFGPSLATFANVQQGVMTYDTGANQEVVSITATGTGTVTGTFAKAHAAGVPYTLQSPYFGIYDVVIDLAATLMSSISPVDSCIPVNPANTADGLHPSQAGEAVYAAIVQPMLTANAR